MELGKWALVMQGNVLRTASLGRKPARFAQLDQCCMGLWVEQHSSGLHLVRLVAHSSSWT